MTTVSSSRWHVVCLLLLWVLLPFVLPWHYCWKDMEFKRANESKRKNRNGKEINTEALESEEEGTRMKDIYQKHMSEEGEKDVSFICISSSSKWKNEWGSESLPEEVEEQEEGDARAADEKEIQWKQVWKREEGQTKRIEEDGRKERKIQFNPYTDTSQEEDINGEKDVCHTLFDTKRDQKGKRGKENLRREGVRVTYIAIRGREGKREREKKGFKNQNRWRDDEEKGKRNRSEAKTYSQFLERRRQRWELQSRRNCKAKCTKEWKNLEQRSLWTREKKESTDEMRESEKEEKTSHEGNRDSGVQFNKDTQKA